MHAGRVRFPGLYTVRKYYLIGDLLTDLSNVVAYPCWHLFQGFAPWTCWQPHTLAPTPQCTAARTMSAHFSPIMIDGALVLPATMEGMIEASATGRGPIPWSRRWGATTGLNSRT